MASNDGATVRGTSRTVFASVVLLWKWNKDSAATQRHKGSHGPEKQISSRQPFTVLGKSAARSAHTGAWNRHLFDTYPSLELDPSGENAWTSLFFPLPTPVSVAGSALPSEERRGRWLPQQRGQLALVHHTTIPTSIHHWQVLSAFQARAAVLLGGIARLLRVPVGNPAPHLLQRREWHPPLWFLNRPVRVEPDLCTCHVRNSEKVKIPILFQNHLGGGDILC